MNQRDERKWQGSARSSGADAIYGLGLIGALVYYVTVADGFWPIVLGILKALVWPAFVVYDLLQHVAG